jgi:chromosome segregation ATPase
MLCEDDDGLSQLDDRLDDHYALAILSSDYPVWKGNAGSSKNTVAVGGLTEQFSKLTSPSEQLLMTRLSTLESIVQDHSDVLENHDNMHDRHLANFNELDDRIDEHRGQLESLDNTVNDHEHRIESLEQELKQIRSMIQDITEEEYFKVVSDEDTADRSLTMTMSLMSI